VAIGNFIRAHYEEAEHAARRDVLSNPSFSVTQSILAAALAKLGRTAEAKAAAKQVLALQPSFSSSGYCNAIGIMPALPAALMEAWHEAGLPP
jgi:Flp pilus assembly protein TadD